MAEPPEGLIYSYTVFHDPTYGASAPWNGSAWVADRRAFWEAIGLGVRSANHPVVRMRADSAVGATLRTQAYVAGQHDLWWVATRVRGTQSRLTDPPSDGEWLQHIVVRIEPDPIASTTEGRLVRDGRLREFDVSAPSSALAPLDDLCWFEDTALGPLALYLVQASKLRRHYELRDSLRRLPSGRSALQADVLGPLDGFACALVDRCHRIEAAQRARASARPAERHTAGALVEELATIRSEESADDMDTALLKAGQNLRLLNSEQRGAEILAFNLRPLAAKLAGRVPQGLLPDDSHEAESVAFEFAKAYGEVQEAVASVSRGQDRVARLLAEREQDLALERTRTVELQAAMLTGIGLLIAAIQAGGVVKRVGAIIGASGLAVVLFVNGDAGYGMRHRGALAILAGAVAGTVGGVAHFHGRHPAAIAAIALGGAAVCWLVAGMRRSWFGGQGWAVADRLALTTGAVIALGVIVEAIAFGGTRHVDAVAASDLAAAAGVWLVVEGLVWSRRRGSAIIEGPA